MKNFKEYLYEATVVDVVGDLELASVSTIRTTECRDGYVDWSSKKRRARAALVELQEGTEKCLRRVLVQRTYGNADGILQIRRSNGYSNFLHPPWAADASLLYAACKYAQ